MPRVSDNIRPANQVMSLTKEQLEEIYKCSLDPIYFIEHYVRVMDVDAKEMVLFKLRPYQKRLILAIHKNRFTIANIPRQAGKSTAVVAYLLWCSTFVDNYQILIAANRLVAATDIMARFKNAYEELPHWIKKGIDTSDGAYSALSVRFENRSSVRAEATTANSGRGGAFGLVLLDEFAHIEKNVADAFFSSALPTITSGQKTKLVVISTPKGLNHFHRLWMGSLNKGDDWNGFVPIEVKWNEIPGRDEKFKRQTIAKVGEDKWMQEFESEFIGSSNTLISPSTLKTLTWKRPIRRLDELKIYEDPKPGHRYFITVDTCRGKGLDFSAYVVFDITDYPIKVVAVYRSDMIPSMLYPTNIHGTARIYNEAYILVEINDVGQQVADILQWDMMYPNMLFTTSQGRAGVVMGGSMRGGNNGIRTTEPSKRVGCSALKAIIESTKLILNDEDIIHELKTFTLQGVSYKADEGAHDDTTMCLVMFAWATCQQYFKDLTNSDIRVDLFQREIEQIEAELVPFGFIPHLDDTKLEKDKYDPEGDFDGWERIKVDEDDKFNF